MQPQLLRYLRAEGSTLQGLNLQGNRLASPAPLELLPSLTSLNMAANMLPDIPASLIGLTDLVSLNLAQNHLVGAQGIGMTPLHSSVAQLLA